MKANELMIGDYLLSKLHNVVTKIISIEGKGYNSVWLENKECWERHYMNEVEPIPLTPEILEKNGFHKEWDEDVVLMVYDTIEVEIGNNYKIYKDGKMYLRRVLAPLYYVHELQHALTLCRIEKEIIL